MVFGIENLPPQLQTLALTTIGFMAFGVISFVFLFIILWFGRGIVRPFITARLRKKSVMLIPREDRRSEFLVGDNKIGMFSHEKYGDFNIVPHSVFIAPNHVPLMLGYPKIGTNINPKFAKMAEILKEGVWLPVLEEKKKKIMIEDEEIEVHDKWVVKKKDDGTPELALVKINDIDELESYNEAYKEATGEDLVLYKEIKQETFRVRDLLDFFKYNANPSYQRAHIESKIAQERLEQRKFPIKVFAVMIPLILVLIIGYMIISNYLSTQEFENKWAACVDQLASCKAGQRVVGPPPTPQTQAPTGLK